MLAEYHSTLVPDDVVVNLGKFSGEHTFESSTYSPPYDYSPRNITSWLAPNISIGAESFNETVVGGPAKNQKTFNPAVIQWNSGEGVGFITVSVAALLRDIVHLFRQVGANGFDQLYSTETALIAETSPYQLNLTYPNGNSSSIFSFIVSTVDSKPTVSSWDDLKGLSVRVSGNVNLTYSLSFAGLYGGDDKPIK